MNTIENNQKIVLEILKKCSSQEEIYKTLIKIGENTPNFNEADKIDQNRVHGCQSQLFITHSGTKDAIEFQIDSDAMISKGLASLLIKIYNGASAEDVLKAKLTIFKEIDLLSIISPARITGVDALEKRVKQIAINYLV